MKVESKQGGRYRILSEINMIPFIDVSLVLLIIFMVMTPFLMKQQIKLVLPDSRAADAISADDKTIDVQVRADGVIFMDGKQVGDDDLELGFKTRIRNPASQGVIIEADKSVSFQRVVLVMSTAKKLGLTKMAVTVLEERSRKTERRR